VAVGTDIIHMHPSASGAALGEASLRDFRYFTSCVARLAGGVYLNCGSAVVLPEVFLKAVALARNRGRTWRADHGEHRLSCASTAPDQRADEAGSGHWRRRPVLVGHHDVLIPLLAAASARPTASLSVRSSPLCA
jgi:hypothetical protein